MKNKPPAFQFYPGDWLSNVKLQSCSMRAQGVLVNLMCYMHQSETYGKLMLNGCKVDVKQLQKLLKMHLTSLQNDIKTLLKAGVLKEENDILYSPRMVRDEQLRAKRRAFGKLGGNPNLVNPKDKVDVNVPTKSCTPPSSSSSSSLSISTNSEEQRTIRNDQNNPGIVDKKDSGSVPSQPPRHWTTEDIKSEAWRIQDALGLNDDEVPAITNLVCNHFERINPALTATLEAEDVTNKIAYFTYLVKREVDGE